MLLPEWKIVSFPGDVWIGFFPAAQKHEHVYVIMHVNVCIYTHPSFAADMYMHVYMYIYNIHTYTLYTYIYMKRHEGRQGSSAQGVAKGRGAQGAIAPPLALMLKTIHGTTT